MKPKTRCTFWRRLKADSRKGSAAIEFAFIAPVFFVLLMGTFEAAIMFFSQAALQNAITTIGRQIRTGQVANGGITQGAFRTNVCNMVSPLIACDGNLVIDVRNYTGGFSATNSAGGVSASPLKADGTMDSANNNEFNTGNPCDVVLVRGYYTMPIYTPALTWFLVNMSGNKHLITAAAAFRNEPYNNNVGGC